MRNYLFDKRIIPTVAFSTPIIGIGNLAAGGTGKTPHTEFLLSKLKKEYKTAVLSRGYKRKTKGFILADADSTAEQIGDEPYQIFSKFKSIVAVDEKRVHGVRKLFELYPDLEIFLLDDAYQHRHIELGLSILLTDYSLLYTDDHLLPYGTLRESAKNSKRADIVIVTKCPEDLQESDYIRIREKLNLLPTQELFFSTYVYENFYGVFDSDGKIHKLSNDTTIILVTGIQNPEPMYRHLKKYTDKIETLYFPDHHDFMQDDLKAVEHKFENASGSKFIITTEKDIARLMSNRHLSEQVKNNIYALPLQVKILNNEEENLIQKIYDYVRKDSTNG